MMNELRIRVIRGFWIFLDAFNFEQYPAQIIVRRSFVDSQNPVELRGLIEVVLVRFATTQATSGSLPQTNS